jgi:hypothetical protein
VLEQEKLKEEVDLLFKPAFNDKEFFPRERSHPRITEFHKLDCAYVENLGAEETVIHPHARICGPDEHKLHALSCNMDVPYRLFEAGLKLFGDSIVTYHNQIERKGNIRYYPSIIMTFWGGFETYVRYAAELMLNTVNNVPSIVADVLLEREPYLNKKGDIYLRDRYRSLLDRYVLLLRYGYNFAVDRRNKHWQSLQNAKRTRDYYTHLDVSEPKVVASLDVLNYTETILLGLIWPSCELKRTLLLGIYKLYGIWARLRDLHTEYIEQPHYKDWPWKDGYLFHCNFTNVDTTRFPNIEEELRRGRKK